ncbi:thioredoxin domain-containing protein [Echinicola strongylocentroti]|uniref:Thioredoxin domain-containing protein n=1 Tax=Echinicola strongylocentroti TaxID=1795355 RepID=A0A2Z4ILN2_9BACT|nr:thioredoxin domain-containing protein [Echinicola strongylocentroti]AWW31784.1 thioredoxin domain-containing protein [Echinicola strongylocentroti]
MSKKANQLIHSQSPYLLQHAHNPVNWYPWGSEALEKAKKENKPIIVSIGYSACHWCHVMEHESFEDETTAAIMNEHFVAIKIDREERPDLDNIYMDAVQSMGLQGGWPLNVFLMPNQKPFYGGTYFPNTHWNGLLQNIAEAYDKHFEELAKSAEGFGNSIKLKERQKYQLTEDSSKLSQGDLTHIAQKIAGQVDPQWGGFNRTPKFPMPSVWEFLLSYSSLRNDTAIHEKVNLTLHKIGMGGIYDHVAGGFARYSVDGEWFAPHFEKMLYDNGQLLSLYAKAYQQSGEALFEEKINETIQWLQREMLQSEGGFYAALDADSEGEEGKFYTWTHEELESILEEDETWFYDLYTITPTGNWEKGVNILFQKSSYETIAAKYGFSTDQLTDKLRTTKSKLLKIRDLRPRPGLDDKVIASWNGLTISGLVQAFWATENPSAKTLAIQNGTFIINHMLKGDQLYRTYKEGKAYTPAFLEDYAAVIQGFIHLYQLTSEKRWLFKAKDLTDFVLTHYFDEDDGLFYFNNPDAEVLIANKKEIFDNVIPSSNALMASNLHQLGRYFYDDRYLQLTGQLLGLMRKLILSDPGFLTQWASLYLSEFIGTPEVAIIGKGAVSLAQELHKNSPMLKVTAASETDTKDIPLLADKVADQNGNALIYVCFDKTCQRPVATVAEAIDQFPKLS